MSALTTQGAKAHERNQPFEQLTMAHAGSLGFACEGAGLRDDAAILPAYVGSRK
jgi:hypothetical protein